MKYFSSLISISLSVCACVGQNKSDVKSASPLPEIGIPGVVSFAPSFFQNKRDANLAATGRLSPVPDNTSQPIDKLILELFKTSYDEKQSVAVISSLGKASVGFSAAIENIDSSKISIGTFAVAAQSYGNPPVIYLEQVKPTYTLPMATKINNEFYVFAFDEEETKTSYYDCIRYAFLLADAADGIVESGFDASLRSAIRSGQLETFAKRYDQIWIKNPVAVKMMSAFSVRDMNFLPLSESTSNELPADLEVGDIMLYTPLGTHPLDESSDYSQSIKYHIAMELAFEAGIALESKAGVLQGLTSVQSTQAIKSFLESQKKSKSYAFNWLNSQLNNPQNTLAIEQQAATILEFESEKAHKNGASLKKTYEAYLDYLDLVFKRNAKTLKTIDAKDSDGKKVLAKLVHNIPAFHVAMITNIKDSKTTIFQIDGANPSVGASFENIKDFIVKGSQITILRRR